MNFKWLDLVLGSAENTILDCELVPKGVANKNTKYFSLAPKLQDLFQRKKKPTPIEKLGDRIHYEI